MGLGHGLLVGTADLATTEFTLRERAETRRRARVRARLRDLFMDIYDLKLDMSDNIGSVARY